MAVWPSHSTPQVRNRPQNLGRTWPMMGSTPFIHFMYYFPILGQCCYIAICIHLLPTAPRTASVGQNPSKYQQIPSRQLNPCTSNLAPFPSQTLHGTAIYAYTLTPQVWQYPPQLIGKYGIVWARWSAPGNELGVLHLDDDAGMSQGVNPAVPDGPGPNSLWREGFFLSRWGEHGKKRQRDEPIQ